MRAVSNLRFATAVSAVLFTLALAPRVGLAKTGICKITAIDDWKIPSLTCKRKFWTDPNAVRTTGCDGWFPLWSWSNDPANNDPHRVELAEGKSTLKNGTTFVYQTTKSTGWTGRDDNVICVMALRNLPSFNEGTATPRNPHPTICAQDTGDAAKGPELCMLGDVSGAQQVLATPDASPGTLKDHPGNTFTQVNCSGCHNRPYVASTEGPMQALFITGSKRNVDDQGAYFGAEARDNAARALLQRINEQSDTRTSAGTNGPNRDRQYPEMIGDFGRPLRRYNYTGVDSPATASDTRLKQSCGGRLCHANGFWINDKQWWNAGTLNNPDLSKSEKDWCRFVMLPAFLRPGSADNLRNPTRQRNGAGTAPAELEEYNGAMTRVLAKNTSGAIRFQDKCDCERFVEMVGCGDMFKPKLADNATDNPWAKLNFCDPDARPELFRPKERVLRFPEPKDP